MRRTLLSLGILALLGAPLPGQAPPAAPARSQAPCPVPPDPTHVDRVVAVVGDSVVLFTDLMQQCDIERERGLDTPPETILERLVDQQVILQHAARDSTVIPSAAEVNRRADEQLESIRAGMPSEAEFQRALAAEGLTVTALRDRLRGQIRTQMIAETYQRRLLQSAPQVAVSESEMRAFYEANKDQLQQRPEILTIQQVLIRSGASDSAWARARQVADSLHALLVRGADFATLAREHSRDPGSAAQGGDLGWVPRGMTVPEFEAAAFALRDGGMTFPVRTEYGFHIILAERSRVGEKRLRHILIEPESTPADIDRARASAEDVAARIRRGESALTLAQSYGDPNLPREVEVPRDQATEGMPEPFAGQLRTARESDVVGPFEVATPQGQYMVIRHVVEVREAGEFTFEDVREQIRGILTSQKRQERIRRDLRERTYVEIRL